MGIKSAFENFKDPNSVKPWDLARKDTKHVSEDLYLERMAICEGCPEFFKLTHQCKECLCIMSLKNLLPGASCPLGKFKAVPEDV